MDEINEISTAYPVCRTQQTSQAQNTSCKAPIGLREGGCRQQSLRAMENLRTAIQDGAVYEKAGFLQSLLGKEDQVIVFYDQGTTKTYGSVGYNFNLDPGDLRRAQHIGPGNGDVYTLPQNLKGRPYVRINVSDLVEATGVNQEAIELMFSAKTGLGSTNLYPNRTTSYASR